MLRSRAAFFWAFVFFAGLQLGLAVAISVWFPGLGDPRYQLKVDRLRRYWAGWPSSPAPLRVVALGSSRTLFGLDAAGLSSDLTLGAGHPVTVFNFGVVGAGPIAELLHFRKLLHENIVPDLMLIEVLPPFLAGQVDPPAEARWFLPGTRLAADELALLARFGFPMREPLQTRWRSWLLPWFVHRRALLSRLGPSWLPYGLRLNEPADAAGWVPDCPDLVDRVVLTSRDRKGASNGGCTTSPLPNGRGSYSPRHYAACFDGFQLEGRPTAALIELLASCRRANIRAIPVLMPETSLFRGWYSQPMETQLEAFLDRVGIPFIDARTWVPDAGFFDADHLHSGGAAILRRKLSRALALLLTAPR